MNLYKSLLLTAVVVTSFGAVFAAEDNQAPVPGVVGRGQAVKNFLKTNKDTVFAYCADKGAAVKAEGQALVASVKAHNVREVLTNKVTITAAVATVVAAGTGIWAYFFRKNQAPAQPAPVVDPNAAPAVVAPNAEPVQE